MKIPDRSEATVRWLQKDDTTFHDDDIKEGRERWQYYIASYLRTEPTEGVPRSLMQKVVLTRNLPSGDADSDNDYQPKAIAYKEGLGVKVCLNTAKMMFEKGTSNFFVYNLAGSSEEDRATREHRSKVISELKNAEFVEKMAMNSPWMANLSQEEVQQAKEDYQKWKDEGVPPPRRSYADEVVGDAHAQDD